MRKLMITLAALLSLSCLCVSTAAQAEPTRDCLSMDQARKVHKTERIRYRLVQEHKCWFAGKVPDKSEFKLPVRVAATQATVAVEARGERTVESGPVSITPTRRDAPLDYTRMVDDAFFALCGEPSNCDFSSRWRLK